MIQVQEEHDDYFQYNDILFYNICKKIPATQPSHNEHKYKEMKNQVDL